MAIDWSQVDGSGAAPQNPAAPAQSGSIDWAALNAATASPAPQSVPSAPQSVPNGLFYPQVALGDFGSALVHNVLKPFHGLAQFAEHGIQSGVHAVAPNSAADRYLTADNARADADLKNWENTYQKNTPNNASSYAGATAGTILPIALSGIGGALNSGAETLAGKVLPAATPSLARSAVTGAGQGAVLSTAQPVLTDNNFFGEKAKQMGIGALTGGVLTPVLGGVANAISPTINKDVQTLLDNNIPLTPGQILGGTAKTIEDKSTSIPFVGDMIYGARQRAVDSLNTAALNRALDPIGDKVTATGREGLEQVADKLSGAYDSILPKLTMTAGPTFNTGLNQLLKDAQSDLPPDQFTQLQKALDNKLLHKLTRPNGGGPPSLNGTDLKTAQSEITLLSRENSSSSVASERALGRFFDRAHDLLQQAVVDTPSNSPDTIQALQAVNRGWANYSILRRVSSGTNTDQGVFTPAQLQSAVRAGDQSVGKGNFAKGNALMQDLSDPAVSVMGRNYPDSGTAGRSALGWLVGAGGAAAAEPNLAPYLVGGAVGGGLASLPYTTIGQKVAQALLTQRPGFAPAAAQYVRGLNPYVGLMGDAFQNNPYLHPQQQGLLGQ